jgi:hypothetical protein
MMIHVSICAHMPFRAPNTTSPIHGNIVGYEIHQNQYNIVWMMYDYMFIESISCTCSFSCYNDLIIDDNTESIPSANHERHKSTLSLTHIHTHTIKLNILLYLQADNNWLWMKCYKHIFTQRKTSYMIFFMWWKTWTKSHGK